MPIEFRCTQCNKLLRTGDDTAGKQAKCPECGAVMTVPLPDQGPVPPSRPMGSFEAAPSPFAAPSAPVAPDSMNPYQSPAPMASQQAAFMPAGEIRPTQIDFSETFSRAWAIFSERWLTMLGGLFLATLVSLPFYIFMEVSIWVVAPALDSAVGVVVLLAAVLLYVLIVCWITIGLQLFTLSVVRGAEARFGLLFAGGRYLLAVILCGILVQIIVMIGSVLLIIPGIIFGMMLIQAQLLIVDRNLGVIEAMSASRDIMVGNKLTVFAIFLVAGMVGSLFAVVTCFLGMLAVVPYMWLLGIVVYLGVTGQPTMADRHMLPPEQPAPGTPPGNSPFAS